MADDVPPADRVRGATAVCTSPTFVFDVPAFNSRRGAKAVRNTPAAVHRVLAVPATLVAAAAVFIGASAHQSAMLAYFATLVVSVVPVMHAAWPELVDRDLVRLDAFLRRLARLASAAVGVARADLSNDMRRLRDAARENAVLAPVYDRAEERARVARAAVVDGLRRWAEAAWSEHKNAALAACFVLHLVGVVTYTAAAALVNVAYEEARIRAPAVLSQLRGVIKEIRCKEGAAPSSSSGFKYRDVAFLLNTVIFVGVSADIAVHTNAIIGSSFPIWFPCFVALCSTGVMVSEWAFQPYDSSNDTGTTADMRSTASNGSRGVRGSRGEPTRTAELKVLTESWRFLWSLMVTAYFIDVYLVRVTLGPRPLALAFVALCNVKIINVGKKVQGSAEGVDDGGASNWRRAAMAVLAASVAKVAAIGVVLNVQLAALSLVSLCITTVLLDVSGAGFARDSTGGGAEEEADEVKAEHSNTSAEDEQEASTLEEQCDSSEVDVGEQQHEEPDSSSSSMDDPSGSSMDSWDFVEADPIAADQS